ncbi:MFS transporter [Gordonia sinesedis]
MFVAGLTTFAAMYCTQALLPELSDDFRVSPAMAALSVSVTTGAIALAIIPLGVASERFGRTRLMIASSIAFTVIGVLLPLSPTLGALLAGRAVQGIALAGVPAVAMAYLAEEIAPWALGEAMGRYVAGTTVGGLLGRVVPSAVLDVASWRWALAVLAAVTVVLTAYFVLRLPASRNFTPRAVALSSTAAQLAAHLRDRRLLALFGCAFVLMGGFVTAYNYLGYRLLSQPFGLSESVAGAVFLMYLAGTMSSALAGRWADRWGRGRIMSAAVVVAGIGLAITIPDMLVAVVAGMLLFTAGFFGAHSVASGWVGRLAVTGRAEASSLYLFAYYLGSSVLGAAGGLAFAAAGWRGVLVFVGGGLAIAAVLVAVVASADGAESTGRQ